MSCESKNTTMEMAITMPQASFFFFLPPFGPVDSIVDLGVSLTTFSYCTPFFANTFFVNSKTLGLQSWSFLRHLSSDKILFSCCCWHSL